MEIFLKYFPLNKGWCNNHLSIKTFNPILFSTYIDVKKLIVSIGNFTINLVYTNINDWTIDGIFDLYFLFTIFSKILGIILFSIW